MLLPQVAAAPTLGITLVVLLAAFLHASWNALVKGSSEPAAATALVACGASLVSLLGVATQAPPQAPAWPYLAASAAIKNLYYFALAQAYRHGRLSLTYPIMRGCAPILVALGAYLSLGESLAPTALAGIALVCAGVAALGARSLASLSGDARALGWAGLNAGIIALYTLVDGAGIRLAGSAIGYVCWMTFLEGLPSAALLLGRRRRLQLARLTPALCLRGLIGGALSVLAYGIALWAMTRAPVTIVAALRETSVLFAALIGVRTLKESLDRLQWLGIVLVTAGVMTLRA